MKHYFLLYEKVKWKIDPTKKANGLLTCTRVHTGCLWFVWASERSETLLNSRHFVNFAAVVLQVGLSELHPRIAECIAGHYSDRNVPSSANICLRCACEGLHMCVHSGMWFCSLPAICGFSLRYFSQTPFLTLMKKRNMSCFLDYSEKPWFVICLSGKTVKTGFGYVT